MLKSDFVLGWKNIRKEDYVGYSSGYHAKQSAVGTTNGAGPRNTQIFVIAPDGVVLHALPGFWHPADLVRELRFAKKIARLWADGQKSRETKEKMFQRMHRREVYTQSAETFARSRWQNFDAFTEIQRAQGQKRDTFLRNGDGSLVFDAHGLPKLKPLNVLVHERMAKRPFVLFEDFDVEAFVDYGKLHYDNNRDKRRKRFAGQKRLMNKRRKAARKAARAAS